MDSITKTTKMICATALGIALYVCVSMALKIPIGIGHLSLDLGYIVLAVYCYLFGGVSGAIVGAAGAFLVSLLASGWMGPEWPAGNLVIGLTCGILYRRTRNLKHEATVDIAVTTAAVFIGICVVKTGLEYALYQVVLTVKIMKNLTAFTMDAVVMSAGVLFAKQLARKIHTDR